MEGHGQPLLLQFADDRGGGSTAVGVASMITFFAEPRAEIRVFCRHDVIFSFFTTPMLAGGVVRFHPTTYTMA